MVSPHRHGFTAVLEAIRRAYPHNGTKRSAAYRGWFALSQMEQDAIMTKLIFLSEDEPAVSENLLFSIIEPLTEIKDIVERRADLAMAEMGLI